MEGARFTGINNVSFVEEVVVSELVAEETTTDVNLLAADDDYLLARQDLLCDNGRKSAEKVALAINNDGV